MTENDCLWVEFDSVGGVKKCPYEAIENLDSRNSRDVDAFYVNYCSKCLEGQKIDALREIADLLDNMKCENCNRGLADHWSYCPMCGQEVDEKEPEVVGGPLHESNVEDLARTQYKDDLVDEGGSEE